VYLPDAAYFDYWSGARVQGPGDATAQATLDVVPVYARVGAIVPMLWPDVETVVTPTDPTYTVVTAAQRADSLAIDVFAGGQSSVTLDDGTTITQSAPADPFAPSSPADASGPIPAAASASDLATCSACAYDDPASNVWSVAVLTRSDTITAGPLTMSVAGAPNVKRFLFRVRH
jgi:hypothetical protein